MAFASLAFRAASRSSKAFLFFSSNALRRSSNTFLRSAANSSLVLVVVVVASGLAFGAVELETAGVSDPLLVPAALLAAGVAVEFPLSLLVVGAVVFAVSGADGAAGVTPAFLASAACFYFSAASLRLASASAFLSATNFSRAALRSSNFF